MDGSRQRPKPARARRASRSFAAIAIGLMVMASPPVAAADDGLAPDTTVVAWDAVAIGAVGAAGLAPTEGHIIFAYLGIAEYDAVVAIHGRFAPFGADLDAPAGASAEAAVSAAAHAILLHYLPSQAGAVDAAYAAALAMIPDGASETDGVAVGHAAAAAVIAARANDGFRAPASYTPPDPPIPGVWIPTAATPPLGTSLPGMRPFVLRSADQLRPSGPPALHSARWARDFNEVKRIGSSTSTARTPEQTLAARFWAEPPVGQARASFRKFVLDHQLDIVEAARFMAMESVVYADALIACWDAKYHYAFWRPITAIRAGGTDGNPRTISDAAWSTLLAATPNHPEYPSAHSCITPAGGIVAARVLGTGKINFTVPSLTGLGDRTYATVRDLRYDVMNARIWGGIHYRSSVRDGAVIARRAANYILAREFRPLDD